MVHCSPRLRTKSLTDVLIACRCISISLTALVDSNYRCYGPFAGVRPAILSISPRREISRAARGPSCAAVSLFLHFRFLRSPCGFSPLVPSPASETECENARERKTQKERERNRKKATLALVMPSVSVILYTNAYYIQ